MNIEGMHVATFTKESSHIGKAETKAKVSKWGLLNELAW